MRRIRLGLTKVEVLVAALCLVIVFALLLPKMESNHWQYRAQCASRLGELMRSVMQFEMVHGRYPGHVNAFGQNAAGQVKVGSWAITIMPYIEQEALYDTWADPNSTKAWNESGGAFNMLNAEYYPKINMFTCASDTNSGDGNAPCSFAINAGFFPEPQHPIYQGLDPHSIALQCTRPANGVFSNQLPAEINCLYTDNKLQHVLGSRAHAPTGANDILDGLTQTLAITESANADSWARVGRDRIWDSTQVNGLTYCGDDLNRNWSPRVRVGIVWQYRAQPPVRGVDDYKRPKQPDPKYQRVFSPELARPSSNHQSVINVAMLGGSVISLSDTIDYRVLQALLTPVTSSSDVPDRNYKIKTDDYE